MTSEPSSSAIDAYILSLPKLPTPASQRSVGAKSDDVREGDYSCSTQNILETRQYDRLVAYNTNSEALWPGAILAGDAAHSGEFQQLVFGRRPLKVSISLENLDGAKSATVQEPSLSATREAIGKIVSSAVSGATPANIYTEIEQVHSEKQLALALGADVKLPGSIASIGASFNFNDSKVKSRYLVKYTQAYYTVDVDQPPRPSAFFDDTTGLLDVQQAMTAERPAVYVSSITYGRTMFFTVESERAGTEVDSALHFAYAGAGVDVSGSTSVTYKDIISSSKINAYILGGSGGEAARSIDSYEGLMAFIKSGGNYSKESPGAPIAYKLAYLADNAPARLAFTSEYELKHCDRVSQKVKVTLKQLQVERTSDGDTSGDTLELYGTITAQGATSSVLFERKREQAIGVKENMTLPADGQILGEAIIDVTPRADGLIKISSALYDSDPVGGDDVIGDGSATLAPFELGWRRDLPPILLSGSGAKVWVMVTLQPI